MNYKYINKENDKTLILLHGTGGDEESLINLANLIDPEANLLGIRGNINENGLNRYFKRFNIGSYDLDSYHLEVENLYKTINILKDKLNLNLDKTTIIGFSNGANIALGLLTKYPKFINNYALLSSIIIDKNSVFNNMENLNLFMTYSYNDPYVKMTDFKFLINRLNNNKSNLELLEISGHVINEIVLKKLREWYIKL